MYLIIYLRRIRLHGLSARYDGRTNRRRPKNRDRKKKKIRNIYFSERIKRIFATARTRRDPITAFPN